MIFEYVIWVDLVICFALLLIGAGLCTVLPIRWKVWVKKEKAKNKGECYHSDWYYSFGEWVDDHVVSVIGCFSIGIVCLIAFLVCCGCLTSTLYTNHIEEPARYEYAIVRAETLKDALEVTEDIVNTDLYSNVVAYNAQLATIKTKFSDPLYHMNFSGDYDWGVLEYINLKE